MLILLTWWTDYQARRGQDRKTLFTDNMKNLVSTEFENSTSYELVKISDFDKKTRIVEESSIIKNPNRKRLLCFPDETISIGEIVEFDNSNWICVMNDTTSNISDIGIIERSNNTLQFYDSTSTLHSIPCIISKGSISLDEQKIISTLDSEIAIQISNTSITRQIPMNYVFKIGMRNYTIVNIDDIIIPGLLILKMVYSEVEQVFPSYSLTILNGDSIQVNENDSLTINAQVKIDGVIILPTPNLVFSSSDIAKAIINSSTGVVTIIGIGSVVFSCKLASDLTITDTINVEIVEVPIDNFTYLITPEDTEIKSGSTKIYTAHKYNNGVEIVGAEFVFSIIAGSTPSSAYTFVSALSVNSCSIKCNSYTYYITLRGTDVGNGEIVEKVIKLRSIM